MAPGYVLWHGILTERGLIEGNTIKAPEGKRIKFTIANDDKAVFIEDDSTATFTEVTLNVLNSIGDKTRLWTNVTAIDILISPQMPIGTTTGH